MISVLTYCTLTFQSILKQGVWEAGEKPVKEGNPAPLELVGVLNSIEVQ